MANRTPQLEVAQILERIPDGDTKIHRHAERDEIIAACVAYAREDADQRLPLRRFERTLADSFDGLDLKGDGSYVRWFLQEYIVPLAIPDPKWVATSFLDKGLELDVAKRKGQIAERTYQCFLETTRDPESSAKEISSMSRAAMDAQGKVEDTLERYRLVPSKIKKSAHVDAQVDLNALQDTLRGRHLKQD